MSDNCIISFANSKGNYVAGLARLSQSLRNNFDGRFLAFVGEESIGAPMHQNNPYAFKVYAFKKALEAGFKKILYLDSSCFAIKNVQPCFDEIEKDGFLMQDAGHLCGNWCNDYCLSYHGVSRDEAMEMKMIGNAGMLGLNFDMELPNLFFKKWEQSMIDGCFLGKWNNNEKTESQDERCLGARHDMSNSSLIINKMNLFHLAKPGDTWLQYAGPYDETGNETIIFKAQGI